MHLRHAARAAAAALLTLSAGLALSRLAPRESHAPPRPSEAAVKSEPAVKKKEPAPARVVQTRRVNFNGVGEVDVNAVEQFDGPLRLEFVRPHTRELVASVPFGVEGSDVSNYHSEDGEGNNPFVRFEVVWLAGAQGGPVIFAAAVTPGASDCGFEALVVGVRDGRIEVLRDEPLFTQIQGGIYVGDLGRGRGPGAAVWHFLWEDGCHYCAHRYEVRLLLFDAKTQTFEEGPVFRSKGKYEDQGEGALAELGLRYKDLLKEMPDVAEQHQR
jgi:hypothetical protein